MKIEHGKYYRTRGGRKIGPAIYVRDDALAFFKLEHEESLTVIANNGKAVQYTNRISSGPANNWFDIVSEWKTGPVEEVTIKRLVPGVYGRIEILENNWIKFKTEPGQVLLLEKTAQSYYDRAHKLSSEELREAARVLNEIADAI